MTDRSFARLAPALMVLCVFLSFPAGADDRERAIWRHGYATGWDQAMKRVMHLPGAQRPSLHPFAARPKAPAPLPRARPEPAPASPARIDDVENACSILAARPGWRRALDRTAERYKLSAGFVLSLIRRESMFRARAKSPSSSALGYSQAIDSTWAWYRKAAGKPAARRTDFADAVDFIGWYTVMTGKMTGLPPDDHVGQALAYRFGQGGFKRGEWRSTPGALKYATDIRDIGRRYDAQLAGCGGDQRRASRYDQTVMARRR